MPRLAYGKCPTKRLLLDTDGDMIPAISNQTMREGLLL